MPKAQDDASLIAARRRFLATCGRFAVATPPVITLMLTASRQNFAVAASGVGVTRGGAVHANNGFGNGGDDGIPGHSNDEDLDR